MNHPRWLLNNILPSVRPHLSRMPYYESFKWLLHWPCQLLQDIFISVPVNKTPNTLSFWGDILHPNHKKKNETLFATELFFEELLFIIFKFIFHTNYSFSSILSSCSLPLPVFYPTPIPYPFLLYLHSDEVRPPMRISKAWYTKWRQNQAPLPCPGM